MRIGTGLMLAGLVVAIPATGNAQEKIAAVAKAVSTGRYVGPTCDISAGHFLVSSAATYLAVGSGGTSSIDGTNDPLKVASQVESGLRVVRQAISENDQGENGAAWYYLGRLHLHEGDIVGADSAFTKAEALLPECAEDIASWRQRAWLPLINPAAEAVQQGDDAKARELLGQAQTIFRGMPAGFYLTGIIQANADQVDSAIVNFKQSRDIAITDLEKFEKDRNLASINLAIMYQRANLHDLAIAELQEYVKWVPDDVDARRGLASSLRAQGRAQEAAAVEADVLAMAEASGTVSSSDLYNVGVTAFNAEKYADAATAFSRVLEKEPHNRDALANLANTYYALEDGPKLIEAAGKLLATDPLNEDNHKLMAQGYRMLGDQEKLLEAYTLLVGMPTAVNVKSFAPGADKATLSGEAVGRAAESVDGSAIAPKAITLVVEFLDANSAVVATSEVAIPALEPAMTFDFTAEGSGAGIVTWRYQAR